MESLFEEQIKLGGPVSVFDFFFIVVFSVVVFVLSLLLAEHYQPSQPIRIQLKKCATGEKRGKNPIGQFTWGLRLATDWLRRKNSATRAKAIQLLRKNHLGRQLSSVYPVLRMHRVFKSCQLFKNRTLSSLLNHPFETVENCEILHTKIVSEIMYWESLLSYDL